MVSPERIRQLSKEGWIEKQGRDQFFLVDVVQGYIRFRNDSDRRAQKSAADGRVRDAPARERSNCAARSPRPKRHNNT
jgi:hypothetical protein